MNPTTVRRPGNPARVFGEGLWDEPSTPPAWERELAEVMRSLGYHEQARVEAAEWARGSMTFRGCPTIEPSDVPLLDEVLTDTRTDATAPADGFDASVFEPGGYQPDESERAWAAATAPARFEATVRRSLLEDAANDALAVEAHERGMLPPNPRPVYLRPVRRRSRPVSDRDVRRSGAL